MERTSKVYQAYVRILQEELIPAMGCTEPDRKSTRLNSSHVD